MRFEVLKQRRARLRVQLRRLLFVFISFPVRLAILLEILLILDGGRWDSEEIERALERAGGIPIQVLAFQNKELLAREKAHPMFQLIDVDAPGKIRKVTMAKTFILFIAQNFFVFSRRALRLALYGLSERKRLMALQRGQPVV